VPAAGAENTSSAGGGSAVSAPAQPQSEVPQANSAGGAAESDSGGRAVQEYDRASLRAALPAIAAQGAVPAEDLAGQPRPAGGLRRQHPPVRPGTLRGVQPIRYDGQPAYVFVYADGDRLTGYVVTEACGSAPGRPATVLDTVS
jgi:hypothetical protein